jgi:hypothetical protein
MKSFLKYLWILILLALVLHGVKNYKNEWRLKSIQDHGEIVEVKIQNLNCTEGTMSFNFKSSAFKKQIDTRTCVVFNVGQIIKLKHSEQYPDAFLFVNERNPNQFVLAGLEIALGLLGLLANWPLIDLKHGRKDFQSLKKSPVSQ